MPDICNYKQGLCRKEMESATKTQQTAGSLGTGWFLTDEGVDSTKISKQACGAYVKPMGILIEGLKLRGGKGGKHLINIFDACPRLTWCAKEYWYRSNLFWCPSPSQ